MVKLPHLPTTIVGTYPQPDWLIDRERLKKSLPPRVRAKQLWRIDEAWLGLLTPKRPQPWWQSVIKNWPELT